MNFKASLRTSQIDYRMLYLTNKTKNLFTLILVILCSAIQAQMPSQLDIEKRVDDLLNKMSIEEKAGQMTQVTIDLILKDNSTTEIDEEKLRYAIKEKKVGSILNVKGHAYSLELWHHIITSIQDIAIKETGHGIPVIYGIDAIHGANYIKDATLFPHNIGMGAARDKDLVAEAARITALETRASGVRWNFDPTLGVGRQPLWSRFEETFGEDTYLASALGASVIKAYEGDALHSPYQVASCMKHYLAYSNPRSGKDRTPAYIPEIELRENYLPPFEAAIKAGTSTVMINSGEVNGVPVHANKYYLTDILRDELGFEGVAVSDWEDIIRLKTRMNVASSLKEAVRMSVEAGLDMSMTPYDFTFRDLLIELVEEGSISEERLDESVSRILKLKMKLGLFENPYPEAEIRNEFGKDSYQEVALNAALHSITLLKNKKNTLPLKKGTKILLAGPSANEVTSLHSSWSFTWQGNVAEHYPTSYKTIKGAFEDKFGTENVQCYSQSNYENPDNFDVAKLNKASQSADVIVLCLGEKAYAESPGIINSLDLEKNQLDLAKAAIATGKPVVLVLVEGRPRVIREIEADLSAVVQAYRPGSQGGQALAEIFAGDFSPVGILPYTYPKNSGDILMYDHKFTESIREPAPGVFDHGGYDPQYAFGHGLSYTTFDYNNLKVNRKEFTGNQEVEISLEVKNTGKVGGHHIVEWYSQDIYASVTPSLKKLRGFQKIYLKPGQSKTVKFTFTESDLSFVNAQFKRVTETGLFKIHVGDHTVDVQYN